LGILYISIIGNNIFRVSRVSLPVEISATPRLSSPGQSKIILHSYPILNKSFHYYLYFRQTNFSPLLSYFQQIKFLLRYCAPPEQNNRPSNYLLLDIDSLIGVRDKMLRWSQKILLFQKLLLLYFTVCRYAKIENTACWQW